MSATDSQVLANQQQDVYQDNPRRSTKRLINKRCRQVLENPLSTQKEILQAAQILEKIIRLKELGSARKRTKPLLQRAKSSETGRLDDLLVQSYQ